MDAKLVDRNLENCLVWLNKQGGTRPELEKGWHAEAIMIGCLHIIGRPLTYWLSLKAGKGRRSPTRRDILKNVQKTYCNEDTGLPLLRGLVEIVRSHVRALPTGFEVLTGALPLKFEGSKTGLDAAARMRKAREARDKKRRDWEAEIRARAEKLAGSKNQGKTGVL